MQKIRQLAHSIFFKIFLGFLVLSFALFGVSNFILNGSGSWIAKVDGKTISYNKLTKAMQNDREAILRGNPNNPQVNAYLESDQFRSDVLSRLVNNILIEKLRDSFGVEASKQIILETVAKDPQFIRNGKFDRDFFRQFLAQNGFDEDRYVRAVQDEIIATMIITSVGLTSPIDNKLAAQVVDLKAEKRFADVISITDKNLGDIGEASEKELKDFYAKHKDKLQKNETRTVSYLAFSKKDLGKVSDEEAQEKISSIEDELLASNSLEEVAKKFNLKPVTTIVNLDQNAAPNAPVKTLEDFNKNAFMAKEKQVSKLFYSKNSDNFYAIKIDSIDKARTKTFEETKLMLAALYEKERKQNKLRELSNKIAAEINQDPAQALQIAAKYGLKVEKNKEFPRFYYLSFQGQNIPYSSKFNEELFGVNLNHATNASANNEQEFRIGILRSIKKTPISASQVEAAKTELAKEYKSEIMQEFNQFLQKEFPIKINEKFLAEMNKKAQE